LEGDGDGYDDDAFAENTAFNDVIRCDEFDDTRPGLSVAFQTFLGTLKVQW
jgi:hypothetical protein